MKVPEPRQLKSGTWFIQLRLGGQSIPVSALTKRECIQRAQLIKAEHRAGVREERLKTDKTVREIVRDYIDAMPKDTSPATLRGYESIAANRFARVMDKRPGRIDWQAAIDAEQTSPKTVRNSWGLIASSLRAAGLTVPNVRLPKSTSAARPFLEPDEILRVLPLLEGRKYEIPALLALHSLRRSEIMALDYKDIDLNAKTISVHGATVQNRQNKMVYRARTKTKASTRIVPIMIPQLEDAIRRIGKTSGPVWAEAPSGLYRMMGRICKQLDIPNVGAHGLRHSFASLAYHLGMSELEAMEIGGWSDYSTMRKIYTHLARADRLRAQNKMADFYKNANHNANETQ